MCRAVPPVVSKTTGPNNSAEECRRGHVGHAVSAQPEGAPPALLSGSVCRSTWAGSQGRKSFASATRASERRVPWRQGSEARR